MDTDLWNKWAEESEGFENFGVRNEGTEPTSEEKARAFQIAFDELMQNVMFSDKEKEAFRIYIESNVIVAGVSEKRLHHMFMLCFVRQISLLGYNNPNVDAEE